MSSNKKEPDKIALACEACHRNKKKCQFSSTNAEKCDLCIEKDRPCVPRLSQQGKRNDLLKFDDHSPVVCLDHSAPTKMNCQREGEMQPHHPCNSDNRKVVHSFTRTSLSAKGSRLFFESEPNSITITAHTVKNRAKRNPSTNLTGWIESTQLAPSAFARGSYMVQVAYQSSKTQSNIWHLGLIGKMTTTSGVTDDDRNIIDGRFSVYKSISPTVLNDGFWVPPLYLATTITECLGRWQPVSGVDELLGVGMQTGGPGKAGYDGMGHGHGFGAAGVTAFWSIAGVRRPRSQIALVCMHPGV